MRHPRRTLTVAAVAAATVLGGATASTAAAPAPDLSTRQTTQQAAPAGAYPVVGAVVGAVPSITAEGRCGVSLSTTTPDAYKSVYLENGQHTKPGFRVARIAANKGCKVVVRSLGRTLTAWGQGPYVWVNLGGRSDGATRVYTSRP